MTNFRRQILLKMFMLLDPGMLTISYMVAAVLTWHLTEFTSFAAFFSMRIKLSNFLLFLGLFYFWHLIFSAYGLYGSRRLGERKEEVVVRPEGHFGRDACAWFCCRFLPSANDYSGFHRSILDRRDLYDYFFPIGFARVPRTGADAWAQSSPFADHRHECTRRGICPRD